jgi:hypothetical protein
LNGYFGRVIEEITDHGGDIVRFAGDAILAVWPAAGQEDARHATRCAARCGLSLQQELRGYRTDTGRELSIKIGVGSGDFTCMHLGGEFARWEVLITGLAFVQSFAALEQAKAGQVVVSLQSWSQLQDGFQGTQLQMGSVLIEGGPAEGDTEFIEAATEAANYAPPEEAVRAYVPGTVTARLVAGQEAWIGELRVVSVLFVNLPDLNYATPLDRAQTIIQYLQQELYRFEGSINKLNLDDKGTSLLVSISARCRRARGRCPAGGACGDGHSERLLNWGCAARSAFHLAACSAARSAVRTPRIHADGRHRQFVRPPDATAWLDIHCDDATAGGRGAYRVSAAGRHQQGQDRTVAVYRPVEPLRAATARREPVGREREREPLQSISTHSPNERRLAAPGRPPGWPGAVVIEGPPGIGKSGWCPTCWPMPSKPASPATLGTAIRSSRRRCTMPGVRLSINSWRSPVYRAPSRSGEPGCSTNWRRCIPSWSIWPRCWATRCRSICPTTITPGT